LFVPSSLDSGLSYRGTLLIIKRIPLGPYCRPMPRVTGGSYLAHNKRSSPRTLQ
jgi:hypothetical protein